MIKSRSADKKSKIATPSDIVLVSGANPVCGDRDRAEMDSEAT